MDRLTGERPVERGTLDPSDAGAQVVVSGWTVPKGRPMSSARVGAPTDRTPGIVRAPGDRDSRLSRYCLVWFLVAPFAGFALAGRVFRLGTDGEDWELWKAAALGGVLTVPYAIGAFLGLRAVLKGCRGGWLGLAANTVLGALSLVMPITESLTF
jgi:hypothetical protein